MPENLPIKLLHFVLKSYKSPIFWLISSYFSYNVFLKMVGMYAKLLKGISPKDSFSFDGSRQRLGDVSSLLLNERVNFSLLGKDNSRAPKSTYSFAQIFA